jgi:hypothetical protein
LVAKAPFDALAAAGRCDVRFRHALDRSLLAQLLWCDTLFLVRPRRKWEVTTARLARLWRRHVIVYWDDPVLDFPRNPPSRPGKDKGRHNAPDGSRSIKTIIETAHMLAVANPRLISSFRAHGVRIGQTAVLKVPALGVDLTSDPPGHQEGKPPIIGYASPSPRHAAFLEQIALPALAQLQQAGIDFRLEIAGLTPALPGDLAGVTRHYERVGYWQWVTFRNQCNWDIALAPLPAVPHFACKFNNKFVEYTAAGIPCIYSNVLPYAETIEHGENGWLADNTTTAWAEAIRTLLNDPALRARIRATAWTKLRAEHSMETVMASYQEQLSAALAPR